MASEMIIEKTIIIDKPRVEVFNFLKYSKSQDQFSVWNMADTDKKTEYIGTDGQVGFIYKWDSKVKNVGAGTQETIQLKDGEIIEYALNFERPMKNTGTSKFILSDIGNNQTKVIWDFRGPTKFPMSLFKGIFQKMLGKDLDKGLQNLKDKLEK